jgi:peptide/nickel transport system substrate-binding protein
MRSDIVRPGVAMALGLLFVGALAARGGAGPLRVVVPSGMNGLDPHAESTAVGLAILANIYEPLMTIDGEGRPVPALAVRAERVGEAGWRFTLRPGVKFHDGRPFGSADVVASLLRARDNPASLSRVVLSSVSKVVAEGSATVRVDLGRRDPIFLERLSEVRIVPAGSPERISTPVGTGPYRLVRQDADGTLTLQAFAGYWGASPSEKQVELSVDGDGSTGLRRLLAGQADLVMNVRPTTVGEIEARDDLWVDSVLGNNVFLVVLNCNKPPFDNGLVREAFDCAVDRAALVGEIFRNYARPAGQLVGPAARGYAPAVPAPARDLTRARALVGAIGGDGGITFTLEAGESRETISKLLIRQLAEAGFQVELRLVSGPEVLAHIHDGAIQAGMLAWRSPLADAGSTFDYIVHSQSPGTYKTGVSTPEIDRLIEASHDATEPEIRLALLAAAAERLAERRSMLPLVWLMDLFGARRELQWRPSAGWGLPLATASRRSTGK